MKNFSQHPLSHPLNYVSVSRAALLLNHKTLQQAHPEAQICPVLKSNAYGHGLVEVAPIFDSMGCPFLVVNSLSEAMALSVLTVKTPILVMGYTPPTQLVHLADSFEFAVFDIEVARALNSRPTKTNIHIFIDTGMQREGIQIHKLQEFLTQLKRLSNISITGLCSHFADADNPDEITFCEHQMNQFDKALEIMKQNNIIPKWKHISASGGTYKFSNPSFTMARVGLAHYGFNPLEKKDTFSDRLPPLQPALEFCSTLSQVKQVAKGSVVGYNCTFIVKEDSVLGLFPAGYFEGVDRRLSNKGHVKIRDQIFPIVGRVSMNMTVVDITKLKNPTIGEKIIVYSACNEDVNSVANTARQIGTIPYDLLVHIAESIPRIIS